MSRIGKKPIEVPADIKVSINGAIVSFEKGKATRTLDTKGNVGINLDTDHPQKHRQLPKAELLLIAF